MWNGRGVVGGSVWWLCVRAGPSPSRIVVSSRIDPTYAFLARLVAVSPRWGSGGFAASGAGAGASYGSTNASRRVVRCGACGLRGWHAVLGGEADAGDGLAARAGVGALVEPWWSPGGGAGAGATAAPAGGSRAGSAERSLVGCSGELGAAGGRPEGEVVPCGGPCGGFGARRGPNWAVLAMLGAPAVSVAGWRVPLAWGSHGWCSVGCRSIGRRCGGALWSRSSFRAMLLNMPAEWASGWWLVVFERVCRLGNCRFGVPAGWASVPWGSPS